MTEEEINNRIDERLDEFARDYFAMRRPGFNIESNCMTQSHGLAEFIISTDENQGIQFYKKGNAKVVANKSIEMTAGGEQEDNKAFAIVLDARTGNIKITCPDGDLILEGANVKIRATDADGDVSINSLKTLSCNAPEVNVKGTKTDVTATADLRIQGGSVEQHSQSGDTILSSGQDPILSPTLLGKILNNLERINETLGTCF